MTREELYQALLANLTRCEIVYRTGRSRQALEACAEVWTGDLEDEIRSHHTSQTLDACFQAWRRKSRWFPTPGDIIPILQTFTRPVRYEPEKELSDEENRKREQAIARVVAWLHQNKTLR